MTAPAVALVLGLLVMIWSADRFIDGAAAAARHFGVPPLLIGMVIIGFGTSAPELMVSAFAAAQGTPGVALGNAYGSNIANVALILGVTALVAPIAFESNVLRKELPILTAVTAFAAYQLWDRELSRSDAVFLLVLFAGLLAWSIRQGLGSQPTRYGKEVEEVLTESPMTLRRALLLLAAGLVLLIVSSRVLVWGAVEIARAFGVSDVVIGLTVVAVGTSLPELASAIAAVRKNEHDIALGNVIGSNLFNTLAVVGLAGAISPMVVEPEVVTR
ncbi:MAG: calcium/sodium antiporter, partial [Gammaproteobacteria bacterium]|nr:calcium/sodium antiporter [Gammaproteobacteria bacterium]